VGKRFFGKRSVNVNLSLNGTANANLENYGILRSNFLKATGIIHFSRKVCAKSTSCNKFCETLHIFEDIIETFAPICL
jgi:hypothetical protein